MRRRLVLAALLLAAAPPEAAPDAVAVALAGAGPGTRIGLVVDDEAGHEIVAIRPDERFVPASNTKIFTTTLALERLDTAAPDRAGGAGVRLDGADIVLVGHGDARLSGAPDCTVDCLVDLAKAVAARSRVVRDVVGDDSAFPDERWPQGMSWNNIPGASGTAVSALTLDDNVTRIAVRAGPIGQAPAIDADGYYRIENAAMTVAGATSALTLSRLPGSDVLRIGGTIGASTAPASLTAGIDDPAHRAAWRFAALLRAAGVRVTGHVAVRHRPLARSDDPAARGSVPVPHPPEAQMLATLTPPPLADDIRHTLKVSQNLHAELLLRRVGAVAGSGSVADGHAALRAMMDGVDVAPSTYDLADGSGMSSYNRVTPRTVVATLRWAETRPWGAAWRGMLPVGGVDGSLRRRFVGTPLAGKVFAKTGTLNATTALSGYLVAASGRTLTFSALANDATDDAAVARAIDRALVAVAAAH